MSEKKTGGQIIWESLMHEGVDVVFGITGGAILPTYDDDDFLVKAIQAGAEHTLARPDRGRPGE